MSTITKVIASVAVLSALAAAPASARIDGDEGGASAYPRFKSERSLTTESPSWHVINRPFQQR
jgi:hypothetical protein